MRGAPAWPADGTPLAASSELRPSPPLSGRTSCTGKCVLRQPHAVGREFARPSAEDSRWPGLVPHSTVAAAAAVHCAARLSPRFPNIDQTALIMACTKTGSAEDAPCRSSQNHQDPVTTTRARLLLPRPPMFARAGWLRRGRHRGWIAAAAGVGQQGPPALLYFPARASYTAGLVLEHLEARGPRARSRRRRRRIPSARGASAHDPRALRRA
jgi:hypothetical protein